MFFGYVTRLSTRGVLLLLLLAGLLIVAGRGDAASLGDRPQPPRPAPDALLGAARSGPVGEAELAITGQIAELSLRGGDLAALVARLTEGANAQIAIRVRGEDVLVAELRSVAIEGEFLDAYAQRLLDPDRIDLGGDPRATVSAALRASSLRRDDDSGEEVAESATALDPPTRIAGPRAPNVSVPEPSTAPLLGAGLLGLLATSRRRR